MAGWLQAINFTDGGYNVYSNSSLTGGVIAIVLPQERYVAEYSAIGSNYVTYTGKVQLLNGSGAWITGYIKKNTSHFDYHPTMVNAYSPDYRISYSSARGNWFRVRRSATVYKADGTTVHGIVPAGGYVSLTDKVGYANSTGRRLSIDFYYDNQIGIWKALGSGTYGWVDVGFGYGAYKSNQTIYSDHWRHRVYYM